MFQKEYVVTLLLDIGASVFTIILKIVGSQEYESVLSYFDTEINSSESKYGPTLWNVLPTQS